MDKTAEGWIQADRGGRPLQAVFLAGDARKAYLSGQPVDDDRFIQISRTSWNTQEVMRREMQSRSRKRYCMTIFPMTLGAYFFPDNGRSLRGDVVDLFLSIYTNGKVVGDSVGPHCVLLDDFP